MVFGLGCLSRCFGACSEYGVLRARIQESNNPNKLAADTPYADAHKGEFPPSQEGLELACPFARCRTSNNSCCTGSSTWQKPWDGPTNKRFATVGVKRISPRTSPSRVRHITECLSGRTHSHPQSRSPYTLRDVPDGTSVTFFAVQAGEAVPWTQPKELRYTRGGPLPQPRRTASRMDFGIVRGWFGAIRF